LRERLAAADIRGAGSPRTEPVVPGFSTRQIRSLRRQQ
jgi:hypothetical protein